MAGIVFILDEWYYYQFKLEETSLKIYNYIQDVLKRDARRKLRTNFQGHTQIFPQNALEQMYVPCPYAYGQGTYICSPEAGRVMWAG